MPSTDDWINTPMNTIEALIGISNTVERAHIILLLIE